MLREVERRMFERLEVVKLQPAVVVDVGCGLGQGAVRLQQRFPGALVAGLDLSPVIAAQGNNYFVAWTSLGQDGSFEGIFARALTLSGTPVGDQFAALLGTFSLRPSSI